MIDRRGGLWIAIMAVLVVGCSDGSGLVPVTGKVTYNGQPVAGATVVFVGDGTTRPATAISGADGSYSVMTLDAPGATPGKYAVVVTKTEGPAGGGEPPSMEEAAKMANRPPPASKPLLPARYGDATRTPLACEVKPAAAIVFDIAVID
jgi:hypothetical protein